MERKRVNSSKIRSVGYDEKSQVLEVELSNGQVYQYVKVYPEVFRRFMAVRSIVYVVGFLTIAGAVLSLPVLGLYYGLHHWTMAATGGVVDARFIVIVNTALASPLGQIAMIPMLAWIANSAPPNLKATYFAVMASFSNLALAASQLGTVYLNRFFVVKRGDYSELGELMIAAAIITLVLPLAAVAGVRLLRMKVA